MHSESKRARSTTPRDALQETLVCKPIISSRDSASFEAFERRSGPRSPSVRSSFYILMLETLSRVLPTHTFGSLLFIRLCRAADVCAVLTLCCIFTWYDSPSFLRFMDTSLIRSALTFPNVIIHTVLLSPVGQLSESPTHTSSVIPSFK